MEEDVRMGGIMIAVIVWAIAVTWRRGLSISLLFVIVIGLVRLLGPVLVVTSTSRISLKYCLLLYLCVPSMRLHTCVSIYITCNLIYVK